MAMTISMMVNLLEQRQYSTRPDDEKINSNSKSNSKDEATTIEM